MHEYVYVLQDKNNSCLKVGRSESIDRALGHNYGAPFAHTSVGVRVHMFPELLSIYEKTDLSDNEFACSYGWSEPRFRQLLTLCTTRPRFWEKELISCVEKHFAKIRGRREWFTLAYQQKLCRHKINRILTPVLFKTQHQKQRCIQKIARAPFSVAIHLKE